MAPPSRTALADTAEDGSFKRQPSVFRERVSRIINDLADRHRGQTIAVVVHGGVIGTFLAHALQMPYSLWMTCENTSISKVRIGPDGTHVVTVNDTHHLFDPVLKV